MTKPAPQAVPLILASASPQRAALLAERGYSFRVVAPRVDESVSPGASPAAEAERLARAKAKDVAARVGPAVVIAADTIVALGGEILGKPQDRAHAAEMLRRLSGTRHLVITGLCVIDTRRNQQVADSVATAVTMRRMTEAEIQAYVASGEADGKSGAYAIQQTADRYVLRVEGSFANVVGLPVERLEQILESFGVRPGSQPCSPDSAMRCGATSPPKGDDTVSNCVVRTAAAPAPVGPYSQAVVAGDFVFTAGQIGLVPGTKELAGDDIRSQTRQVLENLRAVLEAAGSGLDRVVKTTVFLADLGDFAAMNEVYGEYFKEAPPARSAVQVARLPLGALVEIECIARR